MEGVNAPLAKGGPGLVPGVHCATLACEDLYALPERLGDDPAFLPQIGWSDSFGGGERWLALGEADSLMVPAGAGFEAALRLLDSARERLRERFGTGGEARFARYFGGMAFDPREPGNPDWAAGGAARFVLPRVLLRQAGGETQAHVFGAPEAEARRLIGLLKAAASEPMPAATPVRLVERANPLARAHWVGAVSKALGAIASRAVRKVVLARDRVLDSGQAIDPWALMRLVHAQDPHGSRFCLRFDTHAAFMGASPERLVSQRGRRLAIDCLAGTIARGETPGEEARNAATLLASEKDGREHRIVREEVLAAIAPHVLSHELPDAPSILPLPGIQHLWSPIRAQLRESVGLGELVGSLHPTPAVGGSPRPAAMDMIRELEGRSRGWYAGVVGWIGADEADFAVAIRSGLVRGPRLTVFGGAGIVRGSDPLAEWDETARKATSFVNLFAERG